MSSFNVMPDVFDDSIAFLCIYGEIFLNTSILLDDPIYFFNFMNVFIKAAGLN